MLLDNSKYTEGTKSLLLPESITLESMDIKISPSTRYCISLKSWSEKSGLFYIHAQELDKDKNILNPSNSNGTSDTMWEAKKAKQRQYWMNMTLFFDSSAKGEYLRIKIGKSGREQVYLDEILLSRIGKRDFIQPDKVLLKDGETFSSKSLEVKGPDGLIYPNWSGAGLKVRNAVKGPIFKVEDFGAVANDGKDDSYAIEKAIEKAAASGGGIISFGEGDYLLNRQLLIRSDNILLHGTDRNKSRLVFRLPENGCGIYPTAPQLNKGAELNVFFLKEGAQNVKLFLNEKLIREWDKDKFMSLPDATKYNCVSVKGKEVIASAGEGIHSFKALISYENGKKAESENKITVEEKGLGGAYEASVISLKPKLREAPESIKLTKDAKRGDLSLEIESASSLKSGDLIAVQAPETERWNKLIHNVCQWGNFRIFVVRIESVEGNKINLEEPLRIDFPVEDGAFVKSVNMIKNCGMENMTIAQEGEIQIELKFGAVIFQNAWNCHADSVTIKRPGTRGIYGSFVKNCEIRNCLFEEPWRTKLGGLAYLGWDYGWDNLIDGVETSKMRHAPLLNWTSSGNVVRNTVCHESDAQWHSGWCSDNLYEQCVIESTTQEYNGYGYAYYSTPVDDSMHGPNGPRNVVYNCKSISLKDAFYLGGMNQNWMILYNTAVVEKGAGLRERFGNMNNVIKGNVFILKDDKSPMLYYESIDNRGDIVEDNTVIGGNGKLFEGPGAPETVRNNNILPASAVNVEAKAPVPSIYLWQREKLKGN